MLLVTALWCPNVERTLVNAVHRRDGRFSRKYEDGRRKSRHLGGFASLDGEDLLVYTNLRKGKFWPYQIWWSIPAGISWFLTGTEQKRHLDWKLGKLRAVGSYILLSTQILPSLLTLYRLPQNHVLHPLWCSIGPIWNIQTYVFWKLKFTLKHTFSRASPTVCCFNLWASYF